MNVPQYKLDSAVAAFDAKSAQKTANKAAMKDAAKTMPAITDEEAWRRHNLRSALKLGRAGIKVFPNVDKYPSTIRWQLDGDAMTTAERSKHNADWIAEKEREGKSVASKPAHHIGATSDQNKIRRLWEEFPDATPSVSLGISGLFVADADVDRKGKNGEREACDGPALIAQLFAANGFDSSATFSTTSRAGGKHFYFANPLGLRNSGALKSAANVDLKGDGGYVVAPGSIRISDGKRYGGATTADALIAAVKAGLPDVPSFIASKINTYSPKTANDDGPERREGDSAQAVEIKELERSLRELGVGDTVPSNVGDTYDADNLIALHQKVERMHDSKRDDSQSGVRFRFLQQMRYLDKTVTALDGLVVCLRSPDAAGDYIGLRSAGKDEHGVFSLATFCRDWVRAGTNYRPPTDGSAFDMIDDESNDDTVKADGSSADAAANDEYLLYGKANELFDEFLARRKREAKKPKPLIRRSNDIARDYVPIRWLADQAIPMKSITMLFGDSNVGKTFLAIHLANCARRGAPFLGRDTRQCDVLYLFGEGAEGLSGRLKAYADNHEPSDLDIAIAVKVPNLFADVEAAEKVIQMAKLAFKSSGAQVGLIVIDTLQVASSGGNISEQKDMNLVFEKLRRLIDELDVAIVVTHHGSKADPKSMRGSLTLREAADAVWFVAENGGRLTLTPDKLRDGSKDKNVMSARLQVVQIGIDENGKNVTSCIVRQGSAGTALTGTDEGDGDNPVPRIKVADDLTGRAAGLVEVLQAMASSEQPHDQPNEVLFTSPEVLIRMNKWRADRNGPNGKPMEPLNRQQFWRVIDSADEQGLIEPVGKSNGRPSKMKLK